MKCASKLADTEGSSWLGGWLLLLTDGTIVRPVTMEKTKEFNAKMATNAEPLAETSDGFIIHLSMDERAHSLLLWLKDTLEATSIGEVIRRAVQALELFEPEDLRRSSRSKHELHGSKAAERSASKTESPAHRVGSLRSISVRISAPTKARIDQQKVILQATYSDVVGAALRVLAQSARNRENMLQLGMCKKGGDSIDALSLGRSDCENDPQQCSVEELLAVL